MEVCQANMPYSCNRRTQSIEEMVEEVRKMEQSLVEEAQLWGELLGDFEESETNSLLLSSQLSSQTPHPPSSASTNE